MDEVDSSHPSLLLLSEESIAQLTDASVFARLPYTRCDVLGVFRIIANSKGFLPTLSLGPKKSVEHSTEFPSVVGSDSTVAKELVIGIDDDGTPHVCSWYTTFRTDPHAPTCFAPVTTGSVANDNRFLLDVKIIPMC